MQSEAARAEVMGALKGVACVVLFDEATPLDLITRAAARPPWSRGADYTEETVVGGRCRQGGGAAGVMLARLSPGPVHLAARGARAPGSTRDPHHRSGAGFIGSNVCADLEAAGRRDIVVADTLGHAGKWRNIAKRNLRDLIGPDEIEGWLAGRPPIEAVIHIGGELLHDGRRTATP